MDEKDAGRGTQGGVHGTFRTMDRGAIDASADAAARATGAAAGTKAANPLRRRLPPVPDWVWNLARWIAIAGGVTGAAGGALFAGGHASATRRIVFAVFGAIFGGAFGLFVPLVLYWLTVVALIAGLAIGVIALIVWLVQYFTHK